MVSLQIYLKPSIMFIKFQCCFIPKKKKTFNVSTFDLQFVLPKYIFSIFNFCFIV